MLKSRDSWRARDAMKDMTWKERLDYIWTYYNVHILITVVVCAVVIAFLSAVFAPKKQVVYSGMTVNINLTEEGEAYLKEQLFTAFGGTDPEKQEVQLQKNRETEVQR